MLKTLIAATMIATLGLAVPPPAVAGGYFSFGFDYYPYRDYRHHGGPYLDYYGYRPHRYYPRRPYRARRNLHRHCYYSHGQKHCYWH